MTENWRIEYQASDKKAWLITHGVDEFDAYPCGDVCEVYTSKSDAHLIAAAPEMFDALMALANEAIEAKEIHPSLRTAIDNALEVCAKAIGRQL